MMLQKVLLGVISLFFIGIAASYAEGDNVKELSLPYTAETNCTAQRDLNNTKFPDFKRSDCFQESGKFYYYICSDATCEVNGGSDLDFGGDDDTDNGDGVNPFKDKINSAYEAKLKQIALQLDTLSLEKLKALSVKLERLSVTYKDKTSVKNIIGYLQFEVKKRITEKTTDDDVDDFFCELTGDCDDSGTGSTDPIVSGVTINASPILGKTGESIQFKPEISGGAGIVFVYLWDFGDGEKTTTGSVGNIGHSYSEAGSYDVTLTALYDGEKSVKASITIAIINDESDGTGTILPQPEKVCGEVQLQCIQAPCGSKKVTYKSIVELNRAQAKFLYNGECKKDTTYGVCGSLNGKTLSTLPTETDTGLCSAGNLSDGPNLDGSGIYWWCKGTDNKDVSCRATLKNQSAKFNSYWDIDNNGKLESKVDGLLITRYLFNFKGNVLINSVPFTSSSKRKSATEIESYIKKLDLDIDLDGKERALTDGVLLSRYMDGYIGNSLIKDALGTGADRPSAEAIISFIETNNTFKEEPAVFKLGDIVNDYKNIVISYTYGDFAQSKSVIFEYSEVGGITNYKFSTNKGKIELGDNYKYKVKPGITYAYYFRDAITNKVLHEGNFVAKEEIIDNSVGKCGSLNGATLSIIPTDNDITKLCKSGTLKYSPSQDNDKVYWYCAGASTGIISGESCSATLSSFSLDLCGSVNGLSVNSKPTYNLCKDGAETDGVWYYQTSKTYSWSCVKNGIVSDPYCSAKQK